MYIRLDELMQYIDSYEKAYFNTTIHNLVKQITN